MAKNTDITFEVLNIQTEGQMVSAVIQLREYYEFEKLPQPPLPADVIKLAPCDLRITETLGAANAFDMMPYDAIWYNGLRCSSGTTFVWLLGSGTTFVSVTCFENQMGRCPLCD